MKKILCPTDFSDAAFTGIVYASKLAKKIGGDVTLFNVIALSDLLPEEALLGITASTDAAKTILDHEASEVSRVFKISCYGEAGSTRQSISQAIGDRAAGFDLMVMGSNGIHEMNQFFTGSHTYRAIRKTAIPVIMVPENFIYNDIDHIVYAYDFWRNINLPIRQLITFSRMVGCSVTILQVMEESFSKDAEEEIKTSQQRLADFYKDDITLQFETIHAADIVEGIHTYIKKSQADLLALCSEHHGFISSLFHKSVIKSITGKADYPVLIVHGQ